MNESRRNFLKVGGIALAAFAVMPKFLSSTPAHAEDLPLAKESDAMPKSLGYCPDANKPTKQCADRKAKEKKDQFCHNCQLYTKSSGDGAKEIGKCMLMPKNTVPGNGWCKSWVKKPG